MDGAQRNDYYESLYPGLMTSSQAAVVASAAADNHATSSPRHQPPNDSGAWSSSVRYLGM